MHPQIKRGRQTLFGKSYWESTVQPRAMEENPAHLSYNQHFGGEGLWASRDFEADAVLVAAV